MRYFIKFDTFHSNWHYILNAFLLLRCCSTLRRYAPPTTRSRSNKPDKSDWTIHNVMVWNITNNAKLTVIHTFVGSVMSKEICTDSNCLDFTVYFLRTEILRCSSYTSPDIFFMSSKELLRHSKIFIQQLISPHRLLPEVTYAAHSSSHRALILTVTYDLRELCVTCVIIIRREEKKGRDRLEGVKEK